MLSWIAQSPENLRNISRDIISSKLIQGYNNPGYQQKIIRSDSSKIKISRGQSIRMLLLYNCGVIAGSMTALVVTPDTVLMGEHSSSNDCNCFNLHILHLGASGGDFCLITAVLANLLANFDSMNKQSGFLI